MARVAYCIDVLDLFMSKCAAAREKDREFNVVLLRAGLVDADAAKKCVNGMPVDEDARASITKLIERLSKRAGEAGPLVFNR